MNEFFLIGRGTDSAGIPVFVAMTYPNHEPRIFVQLNLGPPSEDWDFAVNEALQYTLRTTQHAQVDGVVRFVGIVSEPPGWFERKCAEANCQWFVPIVKRMAAGENVQLQEIEASYLTYNGSPLRHGQFHQIMT